MRFFIKKMAFFISDDAPGLLLFLFTRSLAFLRQLCLALRQKPCSGIVDQHLMLAVSECCHPSPSHRGTRL